MALGALSADLLLLHAPAVFEFRNRRDIYFPFLGTTGDVPVTPLHGYFQVGFKASPRYPRDGGHRVDVVLRGTRVDRTWLACGGETVADRDHPAPDA